MLTNEQRKQLLHVARESISAVLQGRKAEWRADDFDEELRRPSGAFVTLNTREGELRGCIGSIVPVAPLYQAVATSAVNAAFRDPRFYSLSPDELPNVVLDISVMGPIERVKNVEDIVPGRDGLIISRSHQSGLLLPQVATEYGWDREQFLRHTCQKAGLPFDAWKEPGTTIEKFEAEVFGEETTDL